VAWCDVAAHPGDREVLHPETYRRKIVGESNDFIAFRVSTTSGSSAMRR
jgi:hypothetical protein